MQGSHVFGLAQHMCGFIMFKPQASNDLFPFSSYVYLTWLLVYFLKIFHLVCVSWYGLARFFLSSVFLDLLVTHNAIPSEGLNIFSCLSGVIPSSFEG